MTLGVALAEIVVLREEALRGVIVRVQHDGREVQLMRTLGNFVKGDSSGQDRCGDQAANGTQNDDGGAAHSSSTQIMLHGRDQSTRWSPDLAQYLIYPCRSRQIPSAARRAKAPIVEVGLTAALVTKELPSTM